MRQFLPTLSLRFLALAKNWRTWLYTVLGFIGGRIISLFNDRIDTTINGWIDNRTGENMKEALFWVLDHPIIWPVLVLCGIFFYGFVMSLREYHLASLTMTSSGAVSLPLPVAKEIPAEPIHNVQFVGFKRIQIDRDFSDLALATLCFENILTPEEPIADFHFARLRVSYSDFKTGNPITEAFFARWHDSPLAPSDICAGRKQCAIIASCIGSKWATDALEDVPINPALEYGFGGSEYKSQSVPLPLGPIKIRATLVGARNLSIPSVTGILTLGTNGNVSFSSCPN